MLLRPLHVPGQIRRRPKTPRLIIHPCGMSGGRMQFAPTPVQSFGLHAPGQIRRPSLMPS